MATGGSVFYGDSCRLQSIWPRSVDIYYVGVIRKVIRLNLVISRRHVDWNLEHVDLQVLHDYTEIHYAVTDIE